MLSIDEIDKEIMNLEKKDTSYAVVERLSWLYIVRDHLKGDTVDVPYELTPNVADGSEFMQATSGVCISDLLGILDEHMDVIKIVYPKEHEALIRKIKSLNNSH